MDMTIDNKAFKFYSTFSLDPAPTMARHISSNALHLLNIKVRESSSLKPAFGRVFEFLITLQRDWKLKAFLHTPRWVISLMT